MVKFYLLVHKESTQTRKLKHMAKNKNETVNFSANVPANLGNALEKHRWTAMLTRPALLRKALEEYAEKYGVEVEAPTDQA